MYVDWEYYKIFYYVAKYQNFTKAARVLGNNQPNITHSMSRLESQLNCVRFIRSNRGVTLTPEGEMLYSRIASAAVQIQEVFSSHTLRIYINADPVGCEIGGALKNIIALAAGICDGLHCGDNTKAALMTRGIHEITNLGVKMGGKPETFGGLSGIGDLIVTCCSIHSRNRRAGILIGEGTSPEDAVKQVGTVEGYYCCHAAWALAQKHGVSMPITEQLYHILFDGADPKQALDNLMSRPKKHEYEKF